MGDVQTYSDEHINAAIETMKRGIASLRTQLARERQRREQAEELLQDAESEVWVTCACEPKKPDWWGGGDQWELRPYRDRASERVRRCAFHAEYDALRLEGERDEIAHRLATIERQVRELADLWRSITPDNEWQRGVFRRCEQELRAIIDPEQEPREAAPGQHPRG